MSELEIRKYPAGGGAGGAVRGRGAGDGRGEASSQMIMDWQKVRLGDLVTIKHGWPFKSSLYREASGDRPIVVAVGNFRYDGGFRFGETKVNEYEGDYPAEYELEPGDILLIMTCQTSGGEILGVPGRIPADGRIYLHNQRLGKVEIRNGALVDAGFLYYLFRSRKFNSALFATASGSKILHTAPKRIEAFEFELPPLDEQRRIASILGSLDDKIEHNRRTAQALERLARAIFKAWFVDFEPVKAKAEGATSFPSMPQDVFDALTTTFVDTEIGPVPEGWGVQALADVADFLNGLALQKYPPRNDGSDLPVIKIAQLRKGSTDGASLANEDVPEKYVIRDRNLIFSWSGTLEAEIWYGGTGALNQHLFKVTSDTYPQWLVFHWIRDQLPWFRTIAASKATTMGHIKRSHLKEAKAAVPQDDVLGGANDVFRPLADLHAQANIESRQSAEARDYLLPKLMSGEVQIEEAVEAL